MTRKRGGGIEERVTALERDAVARDFQQAGELVALLSGDLKRRLSPGECRALADDLRVAVSQRAPGGAQERGAPWLPLPAPTRETIAAALTRVLPELDPLRPTIAQILERQFGVEVSPCSR